MNKIHTQLDKLLVSIITPVYNGEKYIEETILSALNQTYKNIEYIIIDGQSTDNSLNIVNNFKSKISKVISEPDSGQTDAINKGFNISNGEILGWLNCDDILLPNSVELIVKDLNGDASFTYGHTYLIDENSESFHKLLTCRQTYLSYRYEGGNIFQGTVMFKKDLWDKYGPLDTSYIIMFEYIIFDQFFKNEKGYFINQFLAKYRIHDETISKRFKLLKGDEIKQMNRPENYFLKLFFKILKILFHITNNNILLWIKRSQLFLFI